MSTLTLILTLIFVLALVYTYQRVYKKREVDSEIQSRPTSFLLGATIRDFAFWTLDPLLDFCLKYRVHPSHLNVLGMILGAVAGVFFYHRWYTVGSLALCLSGICDALDGRVARRR